MYYVLCIMYYVLCITYYVLRMEQIFTTIYQDNIWSNNYSDYNGSS